MSYKDVTPRSWCCIVRVDMVVLSCGEYDDQACELLDRSQSWSGFLQLFSLGPYGFMLFPLIKEKCQLFLILSCLSLFDILSRKLYLFIYFQFLVYHHVHMAIFLLSYLSNASISIFIPELKQNAVLKYNITGLQNACILLLAAQLKHIWIHFQEKLILTVFWMVCL